MDDQKTFHFNDLCELYYGECDDFERAALFDQLCVEILSILREEDLILQYEKKSRFRQFYVVNRKKKEKEAYESELGPWVESVLNSSEGECLQVPDKFSSFTGQLCNLVWHKTSSEASRFLNRFIGKSPLSAQSSRVFNKNWEYFCRFG